MNNYIGDFKKGQVIRIKFNTFNQSMVSTDASVAPQVAVYKNSTTEITTGITQPSANYDSKAGLYLLVIDTSGADYVVGDDYDVVFTQGTVDGVDLTRSILRTFSIENRNEDANVINIGGQLVSASATINFPADIASTTNITSASGVSLTSAYDPAKTAASQTSVNAIPTNPLLTNDARLNNLDAAVSSRLASGTVTVGAINSDVITADSIAASGIAEIQSGLATSSALSAIDTKIDTIDNFIDTEISAIKSTTDKLDTTVELDGLVYRFTVNAVENVSTGGAGGTDWTTDEKTAIRAVLGVPTSGTVPLDPTSGILDTIRDKIDAVDDLLDTEVAAIKTVVDAIEVDTQNIQSRIPSALVGGRIDSSVGSLASGVITASSIAASALDNKGNWNVGKTGYALTQAFPSNFASMSIDALGRLLLQADQAGVTIPTVTNIASGVVVTTNNDKSGYSLTSLYDAAKTAATQTSVNNIPTNTLLSDDARLNNLDASISSRLSSVSYVLPDNASVAAIKTKTDQITFTGGRVDSIITQTFPSNFNGMSIDVDGKVLLRSTDITTIKSGLSLETTSQSILANTATILSRLTSAVYATFQDLATMIQNSGTGLAKWTAAALSLAPSGGGGGGNVSITVSPEAFINTENELLEENTLVFFNDEIRTYLIALESGVFDGTSMTFCIEKSDHTTLVAVTGLLSTTNSVAVTVPAISEQSDESMRWSLRETSTGKIILYGRATQKYVAIND
jgi:hypothetical protein